MKNWLAAGALALAPHLADAGELEQHQVETPVHEEEAADHRRIAVHGALVGTLVWRPEGGETELLSRAALSMKAHAGPCEVEVMGDFAKPELEDLSVACKTGPWVISAGRRVSPLLHVQSILPEREIGVGYPGTRGTGPYVDESAQIAYEEGRFHFEVGVQEGDSHGFRWENPLAFMKGEYRTPKIHAGGLVRAGEKFQAGELFGEFNPTKNVTITVEGFGAHNKADEDGHHGKEGVHGEADPEYVVGGTATVGTPIQLGRNLSLTPYVWAAGAHEWGTEGRDLLEIQGGLKLSFEKEGAGNAVRVAAHQSTEAGLGVVVNTQFTF